MRPQGGKTHWPKYVEGCGRSGRKADPRNWRVGKSIFVAEDDNTARAYVTAPNSPYRYYYMQLLTKLKRGGSAEGVKGRREQAQSDLTVDSVRKHLRILCSPNHGVGPI